jgi:pilus assembly protein CpaF
VIPPLCAKGPIISIRRFRLHPFDADELVAQGFLSEEMLQLLKLAVEGRLNIAIAGGAAAGKTTLLNMLSRFIPATERVVTAEETAELRLEHPHVVALESRPANMEGRGGILLRDLLRTALRMRADRIIVGEVRGEEVLDMLQAMNVGHDGSLTTVHASNPGDVLKRLESLALMSNVAMPREAIREMVMSAINLIVHITRFRNGVRRITSIHEVIRGDSQGKTRELYRFEATEITPEGQVNGHHKAVEKPQFVAELYSRGFLIPESFDFSPQKEPV